MSKQITVKEVFEIVKANIIVYHMTTIAPREQNEKMFVYARTVAALERRHPTVDDDTINRMVEEIYLETAVRISVHWVSEVSMDHVLYSAEEHS